MPRLPSMKIDAKAADCFSASVARGVYKPKEFLSLRLGEEWRIEEFCHPIHLMGISEIERHLKIFIIVFYHDDAVVIDVGILPFALEENCAPLLHFCGPKLSGFKVGNDIRVSERLDAAGLGLPFRFHWLNGRRVAGHCNQNYGKTDDDWMFHIYLFVASVC